MGKMDWRRAKPQGGLRPSDFPEFPERCVLCKQPLKPEQAERHPDLGYQHKDGCQ